MNMEQIPNDSSLTDSIARQLFEHPTSPEKAIEAAKALGVIAVMNNQGIFDDEDNAFKIIQQLKS